MGSNVLEFYVKMKDMMSTGLVKMASQAKQSFKTVQTEYARTNEKNQVLNKSVNELRQELKEVNRIRFGTVLASEFKTATQQARVLEHEIARVKQSAAGTRSAGRPSGGGSWFGGGIMGALRGALPVLTAATLVTGAVNLAKASSGAYRDNQLKSKTFEVLTGNAAVGQELSSRLLKDQQLLGKTVFANAQTMMGFGIRAKDVEKDLLQLGTVAMGNTLRFKELTLAFSQTMAIGKLTGKDLRQFVNAGFNPLKTISEQWKEFGLKHKETIGQLQEMLKKGQISAAAVAKAFEIATGKGGMFGGMLAKMADTSAGKLQRLEGHFEAMKIAIGERIQPVIDSATVKMIGWIDKIKNWMEVPGQKQDDMISRIRTLQANLTSTNTSQGEQYRILEQLKEINPAIVDGIDKQAISYSKLAQNIQKVIAGLFSKRMEDKLLSGKNADVLSQFESDKGRLVFLRDYLYGKISTVSQTLAVNPTLSFGQKQMKAKAIAQAQLDAEKASGKRISHSENLSNVLGLSSAITEWNQTNQHLKNSMPQVRSAVAQLNAARVGIDKYMGLGVSPTKANKNGAAGGEGLLGGGSGSGSSTARGITSGGPRVINVHINKMVEKIEINNKGGSFKESAAELEDEVQSILLRVLNSGASVQ